MKNDRVVLTALVLVAACTKAVPRSDVGSRTVQSADEVPIAYEVRGQGPRTLVFVHGWSCDRNHWRHQMDSLQGEYRVIALDLAGHGASGKSRTDWSIANFANDVAAVVRAVDARKVVLIGHSLGGPVVLEAGLLVPDRVIGVIGVEAFYDGWADPAFGKVIDQLRPDFKTGVHSFVRKAMFLPTSPAALADSISEAMAAAPPEIALPALDSLHGWARDRQAAAVSALPAPVGLIMAAAGGAATAKFHRSTEGRPSLGVEEVPGAGHFLMLELPSAFNAQLREMLSRVSKDGVSPLSARSKL
jgi:pimeloyl-ACP methyl ester carboxylesterase